LWDGWEDDGIFSGVGLVDKQTAEKQVKMAVTAVPILG
jgi:hypothetical protein